MIIQTLCGFLATLAVASSKDGDRLMKTVPTITNSLVNLGKMEISIYVNEKGPGSVPFHHDHRNNHHNIPAEFFPSQLTEQCACSGHKPLTSFLSDPTEIINKILKSNDLFKDPTSSLYCKSGEQENTVFLEIIPNQNQNLQRNMLLPQFPIQKLLNKGPNKPKPVEILLFPRRRDMATLEFANFGWKKRDMPKIEEVKEDIKQSASVKKDLTFMERKNNEGGMTIDDTQTITPASINSVVNNAL